MRDENGGGIRRLFDVAVNIPVMAKDEEEAERLALEQFEMLVQSHLALQLLIEQLATQQRQEEVEQFEFPALAGNHGLN